jgi:TRAP-type C4-dicarboxylate transport system permease large subunit
MDITPAVLIFTPIVLPVVTQLGEERTALSGPLLCFEGMAVQAEEPRGPAPLFGR